MTHLQRASLLQAPPLVELHRPVLEPASQPEPEAKHGSKGEGMQRCFV